MVMNSFSGRLKEERERLGFNQEAFGAIGGVKRLAQGNYEKGERAPDLNYLAAIEKVGADIQYIVTGKRVANQLEPTEQLFLEKYRACASEVQNMALRVLLGERPTQTTVTTGVYANTAQTQINQNHAPIGIDKRGKK